MSDAWIIGENGDTSKVARVVAELGFRPLRVSLSGGIASTDGEATTRAPAVAIIVDDGEAVVHLRSSEDLSDVPLVLALGPEALGGEGGDHDVDELLVRPYGPDELRVRIQRARKQANGIAADDVVRIGTLALDLATYQVTIADEPVDFTFMEYELLRFLATHPNRVFTREALLSRVWGYDYYGGARTVDVHVRRVRAKLGVEHAQRLKTVRSVGYRFEA